VKIVIAPSGFKECMQADEVADGIEEGVQRVLSDAEIVKVPLVDGGEGTAQALVQATRGELRELEVTGPVGHPVRSHFGLLGGSRRGTGVLEMAAAAGLSLVPADERDPGNTTTRGVGELIAAALDAGAERVMIGCGDSGTNDGGAGMAQALGVRLLDDRGDELGAGGCELIRLARIDLDGLDGRLRDLPIDVACNEHNVLCGERGVAQVFGPQKGATPEQVEQLAEALERYAEVIEAELGLDVRAMPGGGASGGLGAGLHAFLDARLHPRYDVMMDYVELDELLAGADLVLTAEGGIDHQTPRGKVPGEVAARAGEHGIPVIALAGTIGDRARVNFDAGIASFDSILEGPAALDDAIDDAPRLLSNCAERVMRMVMVGREM
jgi:glycerate 2-kinase